MKTLSPVSMHVTDLSLLCTFVITKSIVLGYVGLRLGYTGPVYRGPDVRVKHDGIALEKRLNMH